jgi:osmoprotectant transport system permease protein
MVDMKKRIIALLLGAAVLLLLIGCGQKESRSVVVGAKDYTEQDILGNVLQILIEENTDIHVEYTRELSSNVLFAAMQSGDVDVCVDYTGTVYANYLGYDDIKTADEVYDISALELKRDYNMLMLDPLGFNNTYTLAVRPDIAGLHGLKTYSDLAKVSQELVLGVTFEILNRTDGIPNLKKTYNMEFKDEVAIEGTLRYTAINSDEIQVTNAFSTDGLLLEYELAVLEDDKQFFPPYHAAPVIRAEAAEAYPELVELLNRLAGSLNDETMRALNYRVDGQRENPTDVARDFLTSNGFI